MKNSNRIGNSPSIGSIRIDMSEIKAKPINHNFLSSESFSDNDVYAEQFIDIIDLENTFKITVFLEFFAYHFLFFFVFGPLTPILFYPFFRNFTRFQNMHFWSKNIYFLYQSMLYFLVVPAILGYFCFNLQNIYNIEIVCLILSGIIRICVISIKYGFFSEKKLSYIKNVRLSPSNIRSEFLSSWIEQSDFTIDKELYSCIVKNNIDVSVFRIFFLKPLTKNIFDQLIAEDKDMQINSFSRDINNSSFLREVWDKSLDIIRKSLLFKKMDGNQESFSGYLVCRYLLKEYRNLLISKRTFFIICFSLAFIQAIIPTLFRDFFDENLLEITLSERMVIVFIFFGNLNLYFMNFSFLIFGALEYNRPIHLLAQLSNILSANKVTQFYEKKILSTMSIFCPITYKCWHSMNMIVRSYGEKFTIRMEIIIGIFFFLNCILSILCILSIYGFIDAINGRVSLDFVIFGMFVTFITLFMVLRKGAIINEFYDVHREILKTNKDIFSTLIQLYSQYFECEFESSNEICIHIVKTLKFFFKDIPPNEKKRNIINHLNIIVDINNEIIEQLAFYKERKPFRVFGIPATNALLKSLLTGIATLFIAGVQKLLSK